jgi:hypothetical protein
MSKPETEKKEKTSDTKKKTDACVNYYHHPPGAVTRTNIIENHDILHEGKDEWR